MCSVITSICILGFIVRFFARVLPKLHRRYVKKDTTVQPAVRNWPFHLMVAAISGAQVIGNDTAICVGGQHGNFELNVMLPMIANNLLTSEKLLANVSRLLADRAIATFNVNEENLQQALDRNPILVTALNPIIGYLRAAEIAKKAYKEDTTLKAAALSLGYLNEEEFDAWVRPEDMV